LMAAYCRISGVEGSWLTEVIDRFVEQLADYSKAKYDHLWCSRARMGLGRSG
jgi:hypothetical protein